MEKKIKVYVGIPSYDGKPYAETLINIFHQELPDNVELLLDRTHIIDGLPVQLSRNQIVHNFLRSNADYLWFVDDDNPPAVDVLKYLLEHKVDAISAVVPLRKGPLRYCLVKGGKPIDSFEGLGGPLIEVDNIGTGCCLLSQKLVESMRIKTQGHPYQFRVDRYVYNEKEGRPEEYDEQDELRGWRETYKSQDNHIYKVQRMVGEDLRFGEQAQKLGYKFYADLRAHAYHFMGKSEKRFIKNEDCLISNSFIINKNKENETINNYPDSEAGDISGGYTEEFGDIEFTIIGDNSYTG